MALVKSGEFSTSTRPPAAYELYADQTWGGGTQRTILVTLKIKVSGYSTSKYGYPLNWRAYVNGTWSNWMWLKGNEFWYGSEGFRSYTWSYTTDVGTTGEKTISVGFQTDMTLGSSSWETTQTGNFTVGRTNVPPTAPSNIVIRENSSSGRIIKDYFSENVNQLYIKWNGSSDANGDTIYYDLQQQENGGGWASIDGSGTDTDHAQPISSVEGTSYRYWVDARDGSGAHSGGVYSDTITKNTFTMATISSSSSIDYYTKNISFDIMGWRNTQPGVDVNFVLSCKELKVYGGDRFSTPCTVSIRKNRQAVDAPYIEWEDLVRVFGNEEKKGKGTLKFVLTGTNTNGTVKTAEKVINVNIQIEPDPVEDLTIMKDPGSSSSYRVIEGLGYFVAISGKWTRMRWSGSSKGEIGDKITWSVFVSYDDGGWQELEKDKIASSSGDYTHFFLDSFTEAHRARYMIRAISSFNSSLYADATTDEILYNYYNPPSISVEKVTRGASDATLTLSFLNNTSIPVSQYNGRWSCTNGQYGKLQSTTDIQTIYVSGLSSDNSYNVELTYNDTTRLTSDDQVRNVTISANEPLFFVNKYGAGVGGSKADSMYSLNVKGTAKVDGLYVRDAITANGLSVNNLFVTNSFRTQGTINANNLQVNGNDVYHRGFRPTAAEIGALSNNGGSIYGNLRVDGVLKANRYSSTQNQAALTIDKPGSGTFGIGPMGANNIIQYGEVYDMDGEWTANSQNIIHNFLGEVRINSHNMINSTYGLLKGNNSSVTVTFPDPDHTYYARLRIFCRNKQEFSAAYFYVNNQYETDWTLGAHFMIDIEFGYTGAGWVIVHKIYNQFRVDSNYSGDKWTTYLQEGSIWKFELRHSQSGYYFQDASYILEWRGLY